MTKTDKTYKILLPLYKVKKTTLGIIIPAHEYLTAY